MTAKSYDLYVNPDEVTELSDLADKGLITLAGTILDYYNALTYEKAGISEENQNIVIVDSGQTALSAIESGDAVAFWTSGSTAEKLVEAGLVKFLTMDDLGVTVDSYYVSSESYIAEHEDTLEDFFSAILETEAWIGDNQEQAAKIVENNLGVSQEQALQNIQSNELLLDFKQNSIEHLDEIKDWALSTGLFDSDYEITEFVNTVVLDQLFPDEKE
ncbi:MAG: ABC transporter substrate-binding protein [Clostridiales bacterium]|nr:ABC transporter substrate-binding protein [Clostridiales bacterium]